MKHEKPHLLWGGYLSVLLAALLPYPASAGADEIRVRQVPVAVWTKDGEPVDDLSVEEVEVKEGGKKRKVLGTSRDTRPVSVALILDSSQWMGRAYQSTLVPAAMEFWRALPADARFTVWTCGGGLSHAVDFGVEPEAAEAILRTTAVGGPLLTLDAMVEASRHLQKTGGGRRVVVVVTSPQIELSQPLVQRTSQAIPEGEISPFFLLVKASEGGVASGGWDVESLLEQMAEGYGGGYNLVLTAQAVGKLLDDLAAGIRSQYLVRFESEADKPSVPEVKISRKGVRAQAGLARLAH
jgi:hypothetical protein